MPSDRSFEHGCNSTDQDRDPRHGRRRWRCACRLDRRPRRAQRLLRADDVGARRRAAHRGDDLLRRALSAQTSRTGRRDAGAGADAAARRRRRRARLRADGGRPRGAAWARDAGPHDADRIDAPCLRDLRKDRDGRWPCRRRRAAEARGSGCQTLRALRHGCCRRGVRQRDQRGAVRRARRHRRAAVQPCAVRGDDRARRRRREAEPESLRRCVRACRGQRPGDAERTGCRCIARRAAGGGSRRHHRGADECAGRRATGIDAARSEGSCAARPRAQRVPGRHPHDADRRRAPHDRLPGSGLRRALPRPHGACVCHARRSRPASSSTRPRATSRCG